MKRVNIPIVQCLSCGGTGGLPSDKAGEMLRREREEREVPRIVKRNPKLGLAYHFGFSESYTLDLERGVRPWSWLLIERYRAAIEQAVQERLKQEESEEAVV